MPTPTKGNIIVEEMETMELRNILLQSFIRKGRKTVLVPKYENSLRP